MLETVTKLHFSMPASRKASSKERSSSLWTPTPLVKKSFRGTHGSNLNLPSCGVIFLVAWKVLENITQKFMDQFSG